MLKYLPQMEKKSAEGKSSGGKVTRQIVTLKTTLKHTTDNAVLLEKSIGEKDKESEELIKKLEASEEDAREKEKEVFKYHADNVLAHKIQKQINQGKLTSLQKESIVYEDLLNGKFKASASVESLKGQMLAERDMEEKLKSILDSVKGANEGYSKMISLINWE